MISVAFLHECLTYDPATGVFRWKHRPESHFKPGRYGAESTCRSWNSTWGGAIAFEKADAKGYKHATINSKHYQAHRVAYAMASGRWPEWSVDHINGNPSDNRYENLREATPAQQMMNAVKRKKQIRGVANHARKGPVKYSASIRVHLGYFDTEAEAAEAYENAAKKIHDREFYLPNGKRIV